MQQLASRENEITGLYKREQQVHTVLTGIAEIGVFLLKSLIAYAEQAFVGLHIEQACGLWLLINLRTTSPIVTGQKKKK